MVLDLEGLIDRRFMEQFKKLPAMQLEAGVTSEITPMRCAGCGSKIGSDVLEQVLQSLDSGYDPAKQIEDAAIVKVPSGHHLLQSVDYFAVLSMIFTCSDVAALHALGDLFAMGIKPHSAQVLAAVVYGSEEKQYQDLLQLMTGVLETLNQHEVNLLGGHSSEAEQSACSLA